MQPHKGFSLLEILVAFAVMAVALTIVLRIFGSGVNSVALSEDYTLATQVAESLMARMGIEVPLQSGEMSGNEGDKYQWRIRVRPVALPLETNSGSGSLQSQPAQQTTAQLQLVAVDVSVSWGDDEAKLRSVDLTTLKLYREAPQ
ncbi:MAG: type IV pilus modification PilV family protein [Gammaproteobacteria bacterium]